MKPRPSSAAAEPAAAPQGSRAAACVAFFSWVDDALAFLEHTPPFRIRFANAAFLAMRPSGAPKEIEGAPLESAVPWPAEVGIATTVARAARRNGTVSRVEVVLQDGRAPRYYEVTVQRDVFPDLGTAILYQARDITAREQARRDLEAANARLSDVSAVATVAGALSIERLPGVAVSTAGKLCGGAAALYLREPGGALRVSAVGGPLARGLEAAWPLLASDKRSTLPPALESGQTQVLGLHPQLEAHAHLARIRTRWLATIPLEGRTGQIGALLTIWPRVENPRGPDLRALEAIGGQLALGLDHARAFTVERGEWLRLAFGALPHPVVAVDGSGRIVLVNAALTERFGLPPDACASIDRLVQAVCLRRPDREDVAPGDAPLARALRGVRVSGERFLARRSGDREDAGFEISAAPVHDERGEIVGATAVWLEVPLPPGPPPIV
ncbi:MAG TPA: PAS domain-containing protein [Planctomycetota bacterium]|nr:PAS domain-containing protein [Planctomycetota bacterium]